MNLFVIIKNQRSSSTKKKNIWAKSHINNNKGTKTLIEPSK